MPHDIDDLDPGMASESCLPGRQGRVRRSPRWFSAWWS